MFLLQSKHSPAAVCFILLSFLVPAHAVAQAVKPNAAAYSSSADAALAQSAPGQESQVPQPGELGSPFPKDHFWKRIAFEFAGDYSPVVVQGAGSFGTGYGGTAGAIDRLSLHWNLLAEFQILSQKQSALPNGETMNRSTIISTFDLAGLYEFRPHEATSPYLVGGAGYYHLTSPLDCVVGCPANASANAAGFFGGIGIRHRLYAEKRMEIFAESRYHYIASGSSVFGQISLLPVSAGIRW